MHYHLLDKLPITSINEIAPLYEGIIYLPSGLIKAYEADLSVLAVINYVYNRQIIKILLGTISKILFFELRFMLLLNITFSKMGSNYNFIPS